MAEPALLEIRQLDVAYGDYQVLWEVSVDVAAGEIVAILGPNGSGKSTVLKAIMGLCRTRGGSIRFEGKDLTRLAVHDMVGMGIAMVMERRRLFPAMTVRENVLLGAYHPATRPEAPARLEWVESLFPILRERGGQQAGRLSGGEQQMVAIARGLMANPRLLLMDEPYLGLAPKVVLQINEIIRRINAEGIAVVFNEQNVNLSFELAHRGYLLEGGRMMLSGSGSEMLNSDVVRRVYLGE